MRIGLFGGSFDPPHRGHVALARLAAERMGLGRVLFAPVGVQPLKRDRPQASFTDRVAMTQLALSRENGMELSLIDAPRADGRPNYTIDAVRTLKAGLVPEDDLFCMMGADSFLSIGKWYRSSDLLVACDLIVASRPGFDLSRVAAALPPNISVASSDAQEGDNLVLSLRNVGAGNRGCISCQTSASRPRPAASASRCTTALSRGGSSMPAVAAYIRKHGLYKEGQEF